jgi:hypothetical protein
MNIMKQNVQYTLDYPGWMRNIFPQIICKNETKTCKCNKQIRLFIYSSSTNDNYSVTVLRNHRKNVNKRMYTGFHRTALMFYCRKLQVLATTGLC